MASHTKIAIFHFLRHNGLILYVSSKRTMTGFTRNYLVPTTLFHFNYICMAIAAIGRSAILNRQFLIFFEHISSVPSILAKRFRYQKKAGNIIRNQNSNSYQQQTRNLWRYAKSKYLHSNSGCAISMPSSNPTRCD